MCSSRNASRTAGLSLFYISNLRRDAVLVLSRKKDEVITIGDDITVTVIEIRHDKIRLGVQAPRDVPVDRLEVREAKEREKKQ